MSLRQHERDNIQNPRATDNNFLLPPPPFESLDPPLHTLLTTDNPQCLRLFMMLPANTIRVCINYTMSESTNDIFIIHLIDMMIIDLFIISEPRAVAIIAGIVWGVILVALILLCVPIAVRRCRQDDGSQG